ncbi:hypothetical protein FB45DRAFT_1151408 [Roridomyces roridus]|uniref:Uncharacterized protein n=1 Tax=Roridomyces roridus TaxID=1738132 RepID=A0AAD7BTV3_9AGAR|nr:hypothetical protein FB45DRAFT_1151408 [Roridomyces roridus]
MPYYLNQKEETSSCDRPVAPTLTFLPPTMEGFTPRREFLREPRLVNSFSLLALSGPNCIRLYSFPLQVITALRRLLDAKNLVITLREDVEQQLCEIALAGKPWTSAKSLPTEKLLVDIIAVFYQHNYTFLSCIDYGRENDDRLAMAFSKTLHLPYTTQTHSLRTSPLPPPRLCASLHRRYIPRLPSSRQYAVPGRGVSYLKRKLAKIVSSSSSRAINGSTENTFATDSLRLHSLPPLKHSTPTQFSLLTSITLTASRSRLKDLWIFTGPAASSTDSLPESPAPSILNGSNSEFRRAPGPEIPALSPTFHRRLLSEPSSSPPVSQSHARAATDTPRSTSPFRQSNVLRKGAPRAQVPVSVHDEGEPEPLHPHLLPENAVGPSGRTPDVFYSTSETPFTREPSFPVLLPAGTAHSRGATPPSRSPASLSPHLPGTPLVDPALVQPPVVHSDSLGPPPVDPALEQHPVIHSDPSTPGTPPLLSPSAFRDSAFSSATESTSYDMPIPIKWTGTHIEDPHVHNTRQDSSGPLFPGGWQPTPIEEKSEDFMSLDENFTEQAEPVRTPDVQEVFQRVDSPDLQAADVALRKSEAGLVGLIAATQGQNAQPESNEGKGWVVVDVEGQGQGSLVSSPGPVTPASPPTPSSPNVSHAAKAIAIVDAIEAKNKPSNDSPAPTSGLKKFLSLRRKNSDGTATSSSPNRSTPTLDANASSSKTPLNRVSEEDTKRAIEMVHNSSSQDSKTGSKILQKKEKDKSLPRSRLRDKLRFRAGPPEAQPNEDKRRSIN